MFGKVSRQLQGFMGACAASCLLGAAAAQISAAAVHVKIDAQSLSGALTQFGRQTGTEIEFVPESVQGRRSAAIEGDLPRLAVIKQLLAGTGLSYRETRQGAIVIEGAARAPPGGSAGGLDPLTVEARRQREGIKAEIAEFITSISASARDESLSSWQLPICPLVGGLPRDMGEFVLRRVSQHVRDADAPLAPQKCHPNFLIVVTPQPNDLLKEWRRRYPRTFNEERGVAGIKRFESSSLPIRIWYNVDDGCPGTLTYDIAINSSHSAAFPFPTCSHAGKLGSRLIWDTVRVISSVIVVADADRIRNINIGQFADYVAMLGMAQIRLEKDPGPAPTILHLFDDARESRLQGLSTWDQAFLKSLYNTYPDNRTQISQMETRMLNYIAP